MWWGAGRGVKHWGQWARSSGIHLRCPMFANNQIVRLHSFAVHPYAATLTMWRSLLAVSFIFLVDCAPETAVNTKNALEFRMLARQLYGDLLRSSCRAPKGFDRARLLTSELKAVSNFEMKVAGQPAGPQLEIARADTKHETKINGSCWEDSDIRFAKKHIDMTVGTVRYVLPQLEELATKLPVADSTGEELLVDSVEFRYRVRSLTASLEPLCQLSTAASDDKILAPSRRLAADFRGKIPSGVARQYAIAAADEHYRRSQLVVECINPSSEPPSQITSLIVKETRRHLAELWSLLLPA